MAKRIKIPVVCLECGKKFKIGPASFDAECPKCHGVDIEVREFETLTVPSAGGAK